MAPIKIYQVRHIITGAFLWVGAAISEAYALDAMACHAGFSGTDDLPEILKGNAVEIKI